MTTENTATELPLLSTAATETTVEGGGNDTTSTASGDGKTELVSDAAVKTETTEKINKEEKEGEQKQTPIVPEKYEFKLPEDVKLDQAVLDEVSGVFKKTGLTQEQAQALIDYNLAIGKKNEEAVLKRVEAQQNEWMEETKKELGADYNKRMALAAKGRDAVKNDGLLTILKESGLEKNIHVVKLYEWIGKHVSEDVMVEGKASAKRDLSNLPLHDRLAAHIEMESKKNGGDKKINGGN